MVYNAELSLGKGECWLSPICCYARQRNSAQLVFISTAETEGFSNNANYAGLLGQPLNLAIGETTKAVTVAISDNGIKEPSKTFALILQQNIRDLASVHVTKASFTIRKIDALDWSISLVSKNVKNSAGSVAFTLTRASGVGAESVYVSIGQTEDFTNSHDYQPLVNQVITFADGQTPQQLTIAIHNNKVVESDKTLAIITQQQITDPPTVYLAKSKFTIAKTSAKAWWISPTASAVHERVGSPKTRAGRWPCSQASRPNGRVCGRSRKVRPPTTCSAF